MSPGGSFVQSLSGCIEPSDCLLWGRCHLFTAQLAYILGPYASYGQIVHFHQHG